MIDFLLGYDKLFVLNHLLKTWSYVFLLKVDESKHVYAKICGTALKRNLAISMAIIDEFRHELSINNLKWIFFNPIYLSCEMKAFKANLPPLFLLFFYNTFIDIWHKAS
jgi:hypothetical protein